MFLEYEYLFHDCQVQQRSNKQTNKRTKIHETRINAGRSYLIEPTCKLEAQPTEPVSLT